MLNMWNKSICTPLAEIQAEKLVTVIGVVTSMSAPRMSSTGGTLYRKGAHMMQLMTCHRLDAPYESR